MARSSAHQTILPILHEIHHRTANEFQSVLSVLSLRRDGPEERARRIEAAFDRISHIGTLHRAIYEGANSIYFDAHCTGLVESVFGAFGRPDLKAEMQLDAVITSDLHRLILTLILVELVWNSLKHGLNRAISGSVHLKLTQETSGDVVLVVSDSSGSQYPRPLPYPRLVRLLAACVGGLVEVSGENGYVVTVRLPPAQALEARSAYDGSDIPALA